MSDNVKIKNLLYRSTHRGCKELDLLLGAFAESELNGLTMEEIIAYEKIVNLDDYLLYDYLIEKMAYPSNLSLLHKIIDFNKKYFSYKFK